jgi:hypothetical protein
LLRRPSTKRRIVRKKGEEMIEPSIGHGLAERLVGPGDRGFRGFEIDGLRLDAARHTRRDADEGGDDGDSDVS